MLTLRAGSSSSRRGGRNGDEGASANATRHRQHDAARRPSSAACVVGTRRNLIVVVGCRARRRRRLVVVTVVVIVVVVVVVIVLIIVIIVVIIVIINVNPPQIPEHPHSPHPVRYMMLKGTTLFFSKDEASVPHQVIHMQDVEKISEEKVLGRPLAFRVTMAKQEASANLLKQVGATGRRRTVATLTAPPPPTSTDTPPRPRRWREPPQADGCRVDLPASGGA